MKHFFFSSMADIKELLLLLLMRSTRTLTCVLFFSVFVWRSEANCRRPIQEGFAINPKLWLMNTFPDGSNVFMVCRNGYEPESGSDMMTCHEGTWTELTLKCKRKDCGTPVAKPNMRFDTSGGTLFGDFITVICDEGYMIQGLNYKQCMAKGWFGRATCQPITCQKPANVTNGKSSWDSEGFPAYGEVIQYDCDAGYTLLGNSSIVCKNSEYDSPPPECKEASTSRPSTPTVVHRDKTITASTEATITTSQENNLMTADANKEVDYLPLIAMVGVPLGVGIAVLCLYRLIKKKGSYDTREGLKPRLFNV
uniref:complement decay-accelerating factor isoform X3 n=1 Tax=Doryrhamphus excisus TaxID=161450 RepID=UPI0025AE135F|nr:complement decay-accelerating factor isoform X3 [Doryrhamphus excisus]XP_057910493.1 complement decay-accelerating factor isoform X3 [Doryrhamphus excisus]